MPGAVNDGTLAERWRSSAPGKALDSAPRQSKKGARPRPFLAEYPMRLAPLAAFLLAAAAAPSLAQPSPDEAQFRAIYKELVETNTTLSAGSCTLAAQRMAARLKAAGFPD